MVDEPDLSHSACTEQPLDTESSEQQIARLGAAHQGPDAAGFGRTCGVKRNREARALRGGIKRFAEGGSGRGGHAPRGLLGDVAGRGRFTGKLVTGRLPRGLRPEQEGCAIFKRVLIRPIFRHINTRIKRDDAESALAARFEPVRSESNSSEPDGHHHTHSRSPGQARREYSLASQHARGTIAFVETAGLVRETSNRLSLWRRRIVCHRLTNRPTGP